jgi:alpha-L-fucosidase 2
LATSRRNFVLGSAAIAACPAQFGKAATRFRSVPSELWFTTPATRWMEALPLGNGRIGAMIYGESHAERIDLTESTVWSGAPSNKNVNPSGLENLAAIRALGFAGRYAEAARLCQKYLLGRPESFGTHLPMASLQVALEGQGAIGNYLRSLNLSNAIANVEYTQDGRKCRREVFSSNPADVLVTHLTCDRPRSMSGVISFAPLILPGTVSSLVNDTLVLKGRALEHLHSNGQQGVSFETHVRLLAEGGQLATDGSVLHFKNADSITLLIALATNYRRDDVSTRCDKTLDACRGMTFKQLRAAHIADHQTLFNRVTIDLGTNPKAEMKPTDQRRKAVQAGEVDPGLSALFFQYGRYLTIAGSRHNSPLPLALQGIWNDGLASSMGWTDDFHLDINTQQNYWLAEVGNLSECQTPLFDLVAIFALAGEPPHASCMACQAGCATSLPIPGVSQPPDGGLDGVSLSRLAYGFHCSYGSTIALVSTRTFCDSAFIPSSRKLLSSSWHTWLCILGTDGSSLDRLSLQKIRLLLRTANTALNRWDLPATVCLFIRCSRTTLRRQPSLILTTSFKQR